jgi:zinc transport system substrate-binding protein
MKKILGFIGLVFCSLFLLTSCDNTNYDIVVTNFPGYDAARAVTKNTDNNIKMLLAPGSDAHGYDPSANDIATIVNCKVFVYVGGESDEEWVENKILNNVKDTTKVVSMFKVLEGSLYEEEDHDHEEEEHDHDHEEVEYDEHVWTDPTNYVKIVEAVKNALVEKNPENKDKYENNYEDYKNDLLELDEEMSFVISNANRNIIVLADRNPFLYFEKHYNITILGAFPGCSTVEAISAQKKTKLIDAIKANNLDSVFILETTDGNISAGMAIKNEISSQISSGKYEGNSVEIKTIYSMENPSKSDFGNGKTYLDMFSHNINIISYALNIL